MHARIINIKQGLEIRLKYNALLVRNFIYDIIHMFYLNICIFYLCIPCHV